MKKTISFFKGMPYSRHSQNKQGHGLVVTGTWLDYDFPYIGNVILPTDELHHFSEGFKPPTRSCLTNAQLIVANLAIGSKDRRNYPYVFH